MSAPATNGRARVARVVPEPEQVEGAQLAAAVLRVQAAAPKLIRNAVGQIQHRTYGYTTLDAVVDVILPLLVEEQLLWRTFPTTTEDGSSGLRYRITHIPSGEFEEDVMKLLGCADSQSLGSATTYGKRQAMVAYFNLTVDADDDGAASSIRAPVDRYTEAEAAHAASDKSSHARQPSARPPAPSERRITANQREKLLRPRAAKAGLTSGQFANVILAAEGKEARTWTSQEHADQTLDRLLDQLEIRFKDAVLEGIDQAQVAKMAGSGKR